MADDDNSGAPPTLALVTRVLYRTAAALDAEPLDLRDHARDGADAMLLYHAQANVISDSVARVHAEMVALRSYVQVSVHVVLFVVALAISIVVCVGTASRSGMASSSSSSSSSRVRSSLRLHAKKARASSPAAMQV